MIKQYTNRLYNHRVALVLLILVPLALFYKALFFDFSPMDEQWLIIRKFGYLADWTNLWKAFKDPVAQTYYRPLLTVSFILDAHLGGPKPFVFHLTNLLLHIGCVLLLYRFLLLFKTAPQVALLLSLIFAVHPALVHAVAWVPGRNDILLTFFALISFISLIRYTENYQIKWLVLHLLGFACALLSKESSVILPFIYLALIYTIQPIGKRHISLALGWISLAAVWYFAKITVVPKAGINSPNSFGATLLNTLQGLLIYVGNSVWPVKPSVTPTADNSYPFVGLIVIGLFAAVVYFVGLKNKKVAGLGILIFFVSLLLPTYFGASSILGEHYEHRIYLSLAGFILFVSQINIDFGGSTVRSLLLIFIVALGIKTYMRFQVYSSELNYVNEGIEDSPKNYVYYLLKGNTLYNQQKLEESLDYFNQTIQLNATRVQAYANRANVYINLGEKELALADLNTALRIDSNPNLFLNRFNAYYLYKDYEHAVLDLERLKKFGSGFVLEIPPEVTQTLDQYMKERDATKKVEAATQAMIAEPKNALWLVRRAKALVDLKRYAEALTDLKKACELEPANAEYKQFYQTLSASLSRNGE